MKSAMARGPLRFGFHFAAALVAACVGGCLAEISSSEAERDESATQSQEEDASEDEPDYIAEATQALSGHHGFTSYNIYSRRPCLQRQMQLEPGTIRPDGDRVASRHLSVGERDLPQVPEGHLEA